jgi:hypothetical protein
MLNSYENLMDQNPWAKVLNVMVKDEEHPYLLNLYI